MRSKLAPLSFGGPGGNNSLAIVAQTIPFIVIVSCVSSPLEDLPPVATPGIVIVDWPWCDVEVPPLLDCGEWGSPYDVGSTIKEETVCRLAEELKRCLKPGDWARIEGIRTCRARMTHIIVDLPDLRGEVWVILDEESGAAVCSPWN
jgi:hypothetical protein